MQSIELCKNLHDNNIFSIEATARPLIITFLFFHHYIATRHFHV